MSTNNHDGHGLSVNSLKESNIDVGRDEKDMFECCLCKNLYEA